MPSVVYLSLINVFQIFLLIYQNTKDLQIRVSFVMATELKAASEEVKVDLFEDDDEFEEFEINEGLT